MILSRKIDITLCDSLYRLTIVISQRCKNEVMRLDTLSAHVIKSKLLQCNGYSDGDFEKSKKLLHQLHFPTILKKFIEDCKFEVFPSIEEILRDEYLRHIIRSGNLYRDILYSVVMREIKGSSTEEVICNTEEDLFLAKIYENKLEVKTDSPPDLMKWLSKTKINRYKSLKPLVDFDLYTVYMYINALLLIVMYIDRVSDCVVNDKKLVNFIAKCYIKCYPKVHMLQLVERVCQQMDIRWKSLESDEYLHYGIQANPYWSKGLCSLFKNICCEIQHPGKAGWRTGKHNQWKFAVIEEYVGGIPTFEIFTNLHIMYIFVGKFIYSNIIHDVISEERLSKIKEFKII